VPRFGGLAEHWPVHWRMVSCEGAREDLSFGVWFVYMSLVIGERSETTLEPFPVSRKLQFSNLSLGPSKVGTIVDSGYKSSSLMLVFPNAVNTCVAL